MLTIEEKADLERQCAEAKMRCKEVYSTVEQLKKILATYYKDYYKWKQRFEVADRKLAEEERLQVLPKPGERKKKETSSVELLASLDQSQILKIIESLKIEIEKGGEKK